MPFSSNAQRRLFHVKAARGEITQAALREWENETRKRKKKLPERVKKASILQEAYEEGQRAALEDFYGENP